MSFLVESLFSCHRLSELYFLMSNIYLIQNFYIKPYVYEDSYKGTTWNMSPDQHEFDFLECPFRCDESQS